MGSTRMRMAMTRARFEEGSTPFFEGLLEEEMEYLKEIPFFKPAPLSEPMAPRIIANLRKKAKSERVVALVKTAPPAKLRRIVVVRTHPYVIGMGRYHRAR